MQSIHDMEFMFMFTFLNNAKRTEAAVAKLVAQGWKEVSRNKDKVYFERAKPLDDRRG